MARFVAKALTSARGAPDFTANVLNGALAVPSVLLVLCASVALLALSAETPTHAAETAPLATAAQAQRPGDAEASCEALRAEGEALSAKQQAALNQAMGAMTKEMVAPTAQLKGAAMQNEALRLAGAALSMVPHSGYAATALAAVAVAKAEGDAHKASDAMTKSAAENLTPVAASPDMQRLARLMQLYKAKGC
jgi:hypothetical protein